jgi:hypothetical protein
MNTHNTRKTFMLVPDLAVVYDKRVEVRREHQDDDLVPSVGEDWTTSILDPMA